MATKEQCQSYDQCGFVKWRASGVERQALPLPDDGDCGIEPLFCSRLAPLVPIDVHDFGPKTAEEMETSFPRGIEGGANR